MVLPRAIDKKAGESTLERTVVPFCRFLIQLWLLVAQLTLNYLSWPDIVGNEGQLLVTI